MLADRGVEVDHTTIFRWIQAYAAELEKRLRPHLRRSNGSWRVDETYIKVKGCWTYLYRAVDSRGQTIDFLLSAKRDAEAAKRFFRKALAQPHTMNPRTITVDKNAAYPKAASEMKRDGELWHRSRLRQIKYLNNIVEGIVGHLETAVEDVAGQRRPARQGVADRLCQRAFAAHLAQRGVEELLQLLQQRLGVF